MSATAGPAPRAVRNAVGRDVWTPRRAFLDFSVLAALVASWLLIPLPLPHVTIGSGFAALVAAHLWTRRRLATRIARGARHAGVRRRRALFDAALIASVVVMTGSGIAQWSGILAAKPWHGVSSTLVVLLGLGHAWRRRNRITLRLRRHKQSRHKQSRNSRSGWALVGERAAAPRSAGR